MKKNNQKNKKKNMLFGTDGIRGKANIHPMTAEIALKVGKAIAHIFSSKKDGNCRIIIGKDTRLSGYMIESALEAGIVSEGGDAFLVGPLPTPAIAYLIKSMNADAGIMISASHNPAEDNGIKIFNREGIKLSEKQEKQIEELIEKGINNVKPKQIGKAKRVDEAQGRYIEFAKATIGANSLKGLKIVIDCANGAAYNVAPKIFSELGAKVIASNNNPNGYNINKKCGALHPEFVKEKVKKYKADIGIALDGDADRIIMIDDKGNTISGDIIIGILAAHLKVKKELEKNTIVLTVMSNIGLKNYLKKQEIKFIETKVGDKYVIECMKKHRLNLGGEQSGHIILTDYVTTGDGIITGLQMAKVIKEKKKKLSTIAKEIKIHPQELINIKVKQKKDIEKLKCFKKIKKIETKLGNEGRTLIRYSGTENLCRVMVEAKTSKEAKKIASKIAKKIKKEIGK